MADQIGLFERTHARVQDPQTSKEAARSMAATAEDQKRAIYWTLLRAGIPLTAEQIADQIEGLDKVQVGRRMSDLVRDGHVEPADQNGTTGTGRRATRYRLRRTGGR